MEAAREGQGIHALQISCIYVFDAMRWQWPEESLLFESWS